MYYMKEELTTPTAGDQPKSTETNWYTPLTKVTLVSKFLAVVLFVVLPFVGFWLGANYEVPDEFQGRLAEGVRDLSDLGTSRTTSNFGCHVWWESGQVTVRLNAREVSLVDGVGQITDGGTITEITQIGTLDLEGDLNDDGCDDVVLLLQATQQGAPIGVYLAAALDTDSEFVGTDGIQLPPWVSQGTMVDVNQGVIYVVDLKTKEMLLFVVTSDARLSEVIVKSDEQMYGGTLSLSDDFLTLNLCDGQALHISPSSPMFVALQTLYTERYKGEDEPSPYVTFVGSRASVPTVLVSRIVTTPSFSEECPQEYKPLHSNEPDGTFQSNSTTDDSMFGTLTDLLAQQATKKCTYRAYDSPTRTESTGVLYVANQTVRVETSVDSVNLHYTMVGDGDQYYLWSLTEKFGTKFSVQDLQKIVELSNAQGMMGTVIDPSMELIYRCTAGSIDKSKFQIPSDVVFHDANFSE